MIIGEGDSIGHRSLGLAKAGAICAASVFVLSIFAVTYVGSAATTRPDDLHIHRHEHKGSVTYFTDAQEEIDSIGSYLLIASFAAFAALNAIGSRISERERRRKLEAQIAIDDQHPENIR
jgi:hypothetical protein